MFHNIFKKSRKTKIKKKPKIIADIHEKNSLIIAELIKQNRDKKFELEIKPLKIGDYLIGETIIERKTINDFISSIINKRLIQQLQQMQKYPRKLLIIEGKIKNLYDFKTPNAIRGFILSTITNYKIPIIFTQDYEDTAHYLITLAKQQSKPEIEISLHSRIPRTLKQQKQYILEAFPNIGPVTAKRLLKQFKTLSATLNATEEQLEKILRKKAKDFKKILDS